jgi:hypothetical protein
MGGRPISWAEQHFWDGFIFSPLSSMTLEQLSINFLLRWEIISVKVVKTLHIAIRYKRHWTTRPQDLPREAVEFIYVEEIQAKREEKMAKRGKNSDLKENV